MRSSVERWGRFEVEVPGNGARSSIGPVVRFTSPDGRTFDRSAFLDTGGVRRVRFMPDATGRWVFAGPGVSGDFKCVEPAADNPLRVHGRLRVSRCGTHLEHHDGTPFLLLSDTAWNGALLSRDDEWEDYVRLRRAQRFSGVQFVSHAPWRTAPVDGDGRVSFRGGGDDFEIVPEAWVRIDRRVAVLNAAGLVALPVMVWSCTKEDPGRVLSEANLVELLRYQEARFGADHVIWLPFGDGNYESDPQRWCRIGRAVFGADANVRAPVAVHPGGQRWPYEAWTDHAWYDIVGYQSGHGVREPELRWSTSGPPARAWSRVARPVMNLEPAYEGHHAYGTHRPLDDFEVRRALWWSLLLSPTAGVSYGGHGVWSWQRERGEPLNHAGAGEALPWRDAALLPAATQLRHLVATLEATNWSALRPDPDLLTGQPSDVACFIAAASSLGRSEVMVYTPTARPLDLRIDPSQYRGQWVQATSGESQPANADRVDGASDVAARYAPPAPGDWVLSLQRV